MSSNHVPHDILSEILTNPTLSIEDIVRCALVCKSWYSLVTSPAFVSLHHSTQQRFGSIAKQNEEGLLLVRNYKTDPDNDKHSLIKDDSFSLHFDDKSLSEYKTLDSSSLNPNFKVVDSLNGVVCLFNNKLLNNTEIVLWNPTIRKYLTLPKPIVPFDSSEPSVHSIGFGFDEGSNDFKVIRVLDNWEKRFSGVPPHAEVYEVSVGRWRSIHPEGDCGVINPFSDQAFLNGAVHWVGRTYSNEGKDNETIVSFDIQNEVFHAMNFPSNFLTDRRHLAWNHRVLVIGESLSLVYNILSGHDEICSIWVMKEYDVDDSWIQQFNIYTNPSARPCDVFCMRRNGELLVADRLQRALSTIYHADINFYCVSYLKVFSRENLNVVKFVETLALFGVGGKHGVLI